MMLACPNYLEYCITNISDKDNNKTKNIHEYQAKALLDSLGKIPDFKFCAAHVEITEVA
jgi:hypothetical protein